jgi:hypothetical protein
MSQVYSVMAIVFLLLFQGAPPRDALSVEIGYPEDGILKGSVEFEVLIENPGSRNLTVSLYYSPADVDRYEIVDQEVTDEKKGSVVMVLDTNGLDNGDYKMKAVVETDDQSEESDPVVYTVYNPKEPLIKWVSPKATTVLKGVYPFQVNVTGDHGGLAGGASFHYKAGSGSVWNAMGKGSPQAGTTIWGLNYDTMLVPDSDYYFMANATSVHGLYSESVIGPISLDNEHSPTVALLEPEEGAVLTGKVNLSAKASDPDGNINSEGVVFYYSKGGSQVTTRLGNDPDPLDGNYTLIYDSAKLANGRYKIWAYVRDSGTPSTSSWSGSNVTVRNPIEVRSISSLGRVSDRWEVEVSIKEGPKAYPLTIKVLIHQGSDWKDAGGSIVKTQPVSAGPIEVKVAIPLSMLVEGNVTVKAIVTDPEGARGELEAKDLYHFDPMIEPIIRVLPSEGYLSGNASIIAEVLDDDVPLSGPVMFWYSSDNKTWRVIGVGAFFRGRTYRIVWDTAHVANFTDYHIKANHTDSDGLTGDGCLGGFEVRNENPLPPPPPPKEKMWYETKDGIMSAMGITVLVAALLGVALALIVGTSRRSARKREKRRKIEAERERLKGIGHRTRMRERELTHMLTVGSKFVEPVRKPTPRGAVPLKPAERGIIKPEKQEAPVKRHQLQEFEHPPGEV